MRYGNCAWVAVVSDAYRGLRGGVDESHLHRIDYAVGLFQNITNATLIVPLTDSTMSCLQINFA